MIAQIHGKLIRATLGYVIIEAAGVGYKVSIPASVYPQLPVLESVLLIHTSFVIREQSQTLFGFLSEEERDLFEELINISGVGPKTGLSLIGHLSRNKMCEAVMNNDISALSKVPGIGKKTAERLILELKDRFAKTAKSWGVAADFSIPLDPQTQKISDAMNALINLGYTQAVAEKAVKKTLKACPETIDLAVLITESLNHV